MKYNGRETSETDACSNTGHRVHFYPTEYLTYGNGGSALITTRPTGKREYKIVDHLGSTRVVLDTNGLILSTYDYEPFGAPLAQTGLDSRKSFIDKEKDYESGLGNFGVRSYDDNEGGGRFTSIDPLWEKYRAWSPYQYALNSPIRMFDNGGDSVSIITSGPASDNYQGQFGSGGLVGHSAINVDGKIYSFEGDGKWKEYSHDDYIKNESKTRVVIEQTVNVDQSKVQNILDNKKNGTYNVETNSCVTQTMNALKAGGIPLKTPNGAVSPEQLSNSLQNSKYVTNATRTATTSQSSFVGQMLYNLIGGLFNYGVNAVGAKPNTAPLLDKEPAK